MGGIVKPRSFVWGTVWLTAGVLFAGGWFPGADNVAAAPRIGLAIMSFMFAALVLGIPLSVWYVRKFARPDSVDGCPVGRMCIECDTFNFNPRTICKKCGVTLEEVTQSEREAL